MNRTSQQNDELFLQALRAGRYTIDCVRGIIYSEYSHLGKRPQPFVLKGRKTRNGYRQIVFRDINYSDPVAVYLHRAIMVAHLGHALPQGQTVDHVDGNVDNNVIANLRLATMQEQGFNSRAKSPGYKGVHKNSKNTWQAEIRHNRKAIYLGNFDSPEKAARAYDAKARELFGQYAKTNFYD